MIRDSVEVPDWLDVSPETLGQLFDFCDLVVKWNPAINLVSKAGVIDLWNRHILDSAQLILGIPQEATSWCDLGSGGGFPGVVLAILSKQYRRHAKMVLVESDSRKAVFLSEAVRVLNLPAVIKSRRIEDLEPQHVDLLTARALAPLSQLCSFAHRHLKPDGLAIFPKGSTAAREIEDARKAWTFTCESIQSLTDADAHVLLIRNVRRA